MPGLLALHPNKLAPDRSDPHRRPPGRPREDDSIPFKFRFKCLHLNLDGTLERCKADEDSEGLLVNQAPGARACRRCQGCSPGAENRCREKAAIYPSK